MTNLNTTIDEKALAPVKDKLTKAETYANEVVIDSPEKEKEVVAALSGLNQIADSLKAEKEKVTKPLNEALKGIRGWFKPLEVVHANATTQIKSKLIAYKTEEERKEQERQAKLAARVEKGTMKPETAVKKIAEVEAPKTAVKTEEGAVKYKTVRKAYITGDLKDIKSISDKQVLELARAGYLVYAETVVKKEALAGVEIAGVEVKEEKQIANYR